MRFVGIPHFLKKLFPSLTWDYNTGEKVVYITFDDGPIPQSTAWTLKLLKEKNVKATFFCVGDNVKKYPASQYIDSKLFRPPYGMIKRSQIKRLLKDYKIIMWDVLSEDYRQDITPESCYKAVLKNIRPGSIILFHNHVKSEKNMRYALPRLIDELKKQGYQFGVCK